jgi:hypothetical protein
MHVDNIKAKGSLHVVLRDEFGNVKEEHELDNLVVTVGRAYIQERMRLATPGVMSHMAVGTGATAPVVGNTALGTEAARVAFDSAATAVTTTTTNDSVQYVATFPAGTGTGALTEAGLFNAASSGTMLSRVTYAVINKGASDSLTITWKIVIA